MKINDIINTHESFFKKLSLSSKSIVYCEHAISNKLSLFMNLPGYHGTVLWLKKTCVLEGGYHGLKPKLHCPEQESLF